MNTFTSSAFNTVLSTLNPRTAARSGFSSRFALASAMSFFVMGPMPAFFMGMASFPKTQISASKLPRVSALTKTPTVRTVAMTGEITLRGRALEIGGIKEKIIAAHRAGIKTVIMPKDNRKDLEDIPQNVLKDLQFIYVDHVDQVLKVALKNKID